LPGGPTCGERSERCVECWTAGEWCKLAGAWIVQVRELRSAGGVVGYLALHHRKWEQAPPPGWKGRRLRTSEGYFSVPNGVLRDRARSWLKEQATRRRLTDEGRLDDLEGLLLAQLTQAKPRLIRRNPSSVDLSPRPGASQ
jgi:hypothetical protein